MMFDTDVLIWVLRGNAKAARVVDDTGLRQASIVTYMELLQGARDKREARTLRAFLGDLDIRLLPLTEQAGHRASIYMEEYGLTAGMGVADALIAATAVENKASLCTGNQKHYRAVGELSLEAFRP